MKCGYCGKELSAAMQERDRLLEVLRQVDTECRFCAHSGLIPSECADYCNQCITPCPCYDCREQSNWKWKGFEGAENG